MPGLSTPVSFHELSADLNTHFIKSIKVTKPPAINKNQLSEEQYEQFQRNEFDGDELKTLFTIIIMVKITQTNIKNKLIEMKKI